MKRLEPERDWQTLLSLLPTNFEELALEHKLLNGIRCTEPGLEGVAS
jgi:hypothetical protein